MSEWVRDLAHPQHRPTPGRAKDRVTEGLKTVASDDQNGLSAWLWTHVPEGPGRARDPAKSRRLDCAVPAIQL